MTNLEIFLTVWSSLSPVIAVVVAILVARRNKDKDHENVGQERGAMQSDIGYIKSSTDRIERQITQLDNKQDAMSERLARLETRVEEHLKDKNAHNFKAPKGAK